MFTTPDGGVLDPSSISREFDRLAARHGLRRIRLHDLRHTSASLGLESGESLVEVSRRLGHSSITITADTYSHLLEGVGRKAADAADALIPRQQTESRDQSVTSSLASLIGREDPGPITKP